MTVLAIFKSCVLVVMTPSIAGMCQHSLCGSDINVMQWYNFFLYYLIIQNGMFGRMWSTLFCTMKGDINSDKRHLQPVIPTINVQIRDTHLRNLKRNEVMGI